MSRFNINPIIGQLKLIRSEITNSNTEVKKIREDQEQRNLIDKKNKEVNWKKVEEPERYPLANYNLKKLKII